MRRLGSARLPPLRGVMAGRVRPLAEAMKKKVGPGPSHGKTKYPGAPCWSCEKVFDPSNSLFCNGCHKLQPLVRAETYFELLDLPVSLLLEPQVLERKFQALQRQVHPDMYVSKTPQEQQIAMARSAAAGEAYQTLKDPISRAKYVLAIRGVDLESHTLNDPELLGEVMETQEALSEMTDKEEMKKTAAELGKKVETCLKEADDLLEHHGDFALSPVTQMVIRAQYYNKLKQDCEQMGGV